MERTENFHLIRNDNGEWVSDEYAVFLTEMDACVLQIKAARQNLSLSVQHGSDKQLWCYKHELEAIDINHPSIKKRILRINHKKR